MRRLCFNTAGPGQGQMVHELFPILCGHCMLQAYAVRPATGKRLCMDGAAVWRWRLLCRPTTRSVMPSSLLDASDSCCIPVLGQSDTRRCRPRPALRSRCEGRELRYQISPVEATREAQLTSKDPEGVTARRAQWTRNPHGACGLCCGPSCRHGTWLLADARQGKKSTNRRARSRPQVYSPRGPAKANIAVSIADPDRYANALLCLGGAWGCSACPAWESRVQAPTKATIWIRRGALQNARG